MSQELGKHPYNKNLLSYKVQSKTKAEAKKIVSGKREKINAGSVYFL